MFCALKARVAKYKQYRRIVKEIKAMDHHDLLDIGAPRDEMLRGAFEKIYGQ